MLNMLAASNSSNPKSSMFLSALEAPCKDASELFQRASQPAHALAPKAHQEHALDGTRMQAHFQCAIKQAFAVGARRMGHHMDDDVAIPIGLPMQERPCGARVHWSLVWGK